MSDKTTLGFYLERELKSRNWSMRELARRSGVSHATLSLISRGKTTPEVYTLEQIARALDVPPAEVIALVLGTDPRSQQEHPDFQVDPASMDIARRLASLPAGLKARTIDAVIGLIEAVELAAGISRR